MGRWFLALALCFSLHAEDAKLPTDLTISTAGVPAIALHDVRFNCQPLEGINKPCFAASVDQEKSGSWTELKLSVSTYSDDGKLLGSNFVSGRLDKSGFITGFQDEFAAAYGYKADTIVKADIEAIEGRTKTYEKRQSYSGPVVKDAGCYKDFLRASGLEGVQQRKALTELIQYGCVVMIERPVAVETTQSERPKWFPGGIWISTISDNRVVFGYVPSSDVRQESLPHERYYSRAAK